MKRSWLTIIFLSIIPYLNYGQEGKIPERQVISNLEIEAKPTAKTVKLKPVTDERFGFQLAKRRKITRIPFEFQAKFSHSPCKSQ